MLITFSPAAFAGEGEGEGEAESEVPEQVISQEVIDIIESANATQVVQQCLADGGTPEIVCVKDGKSVRDAEDAAGVTPKPPSTTQKKRLKQTLADRVLWCEKEILKLQKRVKALEEQGDAPYVQLPAPPSAGRPAPPDQKLREDHNRLVVVVSRLQEIMKPLGEDYAVLAKELTDLQFKIGKLEVQMEEVLSRLDDVEKRLDRLEQVRGSGLFIGLQPTIVGSWTSLAPTFTGLPEFDEDNEQVGEDGTQRLRDNYAGASRADVVVGGTFDNNWNVRVVGGLGTTYNSVQSVAGNTSMVTGMNFHLSGETLYTVVQDGDMNLSVGPYLAYSLDRVGFFPTLRQSIDDHAISAGLAAQLQIAQVGPIAFTLNGRLGGGMDLLGTSEKVSGGAHWWNAGRVEGAVGFGILFKTPQFGE